MKKLTVFIIILGLYLTVSGQITKTPDCLYLKKAYTCFCNKKYRKVIKTLDEFTKKYPNHPLVEEANYAIGMAYFYKGDDKGAMKVFQQIISKTDYPNIDSPYDISGCVNIGIQCHANILIPDFSLNVQHLTCLQIAEIGFREKNYPLVFSYLVNADRYYRYWYGCGTGDMEENIRMAKAFARYYTEVNKKDSAIKVLLAQSLEPAALGLNGYAELKDRLIVLLKASYTLEEIKSKFDEAIENVLYDSHLNDKNIEFRDYYIRFMDVRINVAPTYLFAKTTDLSVVKDYIRKTDLYLELFNLPKPE